MFEIRRACLKDLVQITNIYNWAISSTLSTFDTDPKTTTEQEKWFSDHDENFCILVAEDKNKILGWTSLNRWSSRKAYSKTAEVSLFVDKNHHGKGVGTQLLGALVIADKKKGFYSVLARITEGGEASIGIYKKLGFQKVGTMKEVGNKFDQVLDVDLMQLML